MRILVIGGGGREHALIWKLKQSPKVDYLWCAPGNGGIAQDAECIPVPSASPDALAALALKLSPDLTVVGPEQPLVAGVVDEFISRGMSILGPTKSAGRLEGSKIFAKQFLQRHHLPTARTIGICDSSHAAKLAIERFGGRLVVKADGLCAGKGVLVTESKKDACAFVEHLMDRREFGDSGRNILIEEALNGREVSFIILADGQHFVPMVPAQDHKRAFDADKGPNTGGMGAFTMDTLIDRPLETELIEKVVQPTLAGMASEGAPYRGFLYFGLMITAQGPQVLEFNCRMGDPECQAIVTRMDFDLAEALEAAASGQLDKALIRWRPGASVCLVLASGGYPVKYEIGKPIDGLEEAQLAGPAIIFHAGTRRADGRYFTSGGRVLGVTATCPDLPAAAACAYRAAEVARFDGMYYRKDIGVVK